MFRYTTFFYVVAIACSIIVVGSAAAQSREDWRASEDKKSTSSLDLVQGYHGVTPGSGNNLPKIDELKGKEGNWITWPGFTMLPNGGSRIFLQSTMLIKYQMTADKKNTMVLKFENTNVHLGNNRNPLVTTHFNTPLTKAFLKKQKKINAYELVILLRVDQKPTVNQATGQDGYYYLFVDFPAGDYPIPETKEDDEEVPSYTGLGSLKNEPLEGADEIPPGLGN